MDSPAAFMIVTCKIDPSQKQDFKHYVSNARPIFGAHGGTPVGQYAVAERVVGQSQTTHVIIMAFPSQDAIRSVFADPAYTALIPNRTRAFPVLDIHIAEDFNPATLLAGSV
ncbi:MAG: hypothetical protein ACI9VR_003988 [Cognaticolwellia sp.]|jgi:uncharacterized protein (DUF1330 family)